MHSALSHKIVIVSVNSIELLLLKIEQKVIPNYDR